MIELHGPLTKKKYDSILISKKENIFYISGFEGSAGFVFIKKNKKYLFTDKRYVGIAEKQVFFDVEIIYYKNFFQSFEDFLKKQNIKKLGIEKKNLTISFFEFMKNKLNFLSFFDINDFIEEKRETKNKMEIEKIKFASKITDEAMDKMRDFIKISATEKEIVNKIKIFFLEQNCDIAFEPIVAFGKNSSSPHHKSGNTKLKKNKIILVDLGAKYKNYNSDETRIFVLGKAKTEEKNIYNIILTEQKKAIKKATTGQKINKIENDLRKNFDKFSDNFTHSLGHGVGINIHENPVMSSSVDNHKVLKKNSVITIEPGLYFEKKFGIRIEDTILVDKQAKRFTKFYKNEIFEIK